MKRKRVIWSLAIATVVLLAISSIAFALFARMLRSARGEHTGGSGPRGVSQTLQDITQIVGNPRDGFPGQDRVTILCMGIDDNWTNSDVVYSSNARTDTLFLLTLDLAHHKATMLSIPRDTYTHIAGTHWNTKINAAFATGGPQRAIATVNGLLGVRADHFMVLNIDATKKMVEALGGVDVNIEHEMHYHDKWGHLSIDLMPGQQHLSSDQAVGYARYRHGDRGTRPSPEDGDERRMYRQHVLLKAFVAKAKTFTTVAQAPHLIDVGMSTIHTDLTRTQLFDLAALYRGVGQDDIQTASLPGDDFRGPHGEWFYRLNADKARAYVDWLVRGDESASHRLVTVVVRNGTGQPGLARQAVAQLEASGYTDAHSDTNALSSLPLARTTLLDTGVADATAAGDVASTLGLASAVQTRRAAKSDKHGEIAPPTLTVMLGQDYAQKVVSARV